ncbi:hypothetical protein ACF1BQ_029910 [Bradyrhizobium sp. RDT10]
MIMSSAKLALDPAIGLGRPRIDHEPVAVLDLCSGRIAAVLRRKPSAQNDRRACPVSNGVQRLSGSKHRPLTAASELFKLNQKLNALKRRWHGGCY